MEHTKFCAHDDDRAQKPNLPLEKGDATRSFHPFVYRQATNETQHVLLLAGLFLT
jgi:hypothetical protein